LAALLRRIPQGENLRFVCNLVLGVCDFINSSTPKQLAIFTGNAIELWNGPKDQVFQD
jgi:hypothetical protein